VTIIGITPIGKDKCLEVLGLGKKLVNPVVGKTTIELRIIGQVAKTVVVATNSRKRRKLRRDKTIKNEFLLHALLW